MKTEYRSAALLTPAEETSTGVKHLRALAVPYGEDYTEIFPGFFERFTKGALTPAADPMKLKLEHSETIGKIIETKETDQGLEITAVISDTTSGRDAATLLEDGVLTRVSIGFIPDADSQEIKSDKQGNIYIIHHRAQLLEVSIVSFPAYESAIVQEIRSKNNQPKEKESLAMDKLEDQISEVRQSMAEISRELAETRSQITTTPALHPLNNYRSAGEYMKAYATGADNIREYADDSTLIGDVSVKPYWLEREIKLMEAKQPVTKLFTHAYDLPKEGMSFDYPTFANSTIKVAKQEKEGDELVHGKLKLSSENVKVKTFGGYAPLSRQAVDRASAAYLSTIWKAQGIQYATAIEAQTRSSLKTTLEENVKTTSIESQLTATTLTVDEFINLTLDIIDYFDDEVLFPFTGIAVSANVFSYLSTLGEKAKAFQFTGAPADKIGYLSINSRNAAIDGLQISRLPQSAGENHLFGYSSEAVTVHESSNAPLRLSDERDDTNLTNIFTVYGYAAHEVQAAGIVPVKFGQGLG